MTSPDECSHEGRVRSWPVGSSAQRKIHQRRRAGEDSWRTQDINWYTRTADRSTIVVLDRTDTRIGV